MSFKLTRNIIFHSSFTNLRACFFARIRAGCVDRLSVLMMMTTAHKLVKMITVAINLALINSLKLVATLSKTGDSIQRWIHETFLNQ